MAKDDFSGLISSLEDKYHLPKGMLERQMMAESSGDPKAVSSAGAEGLMQLEPRTARDLGVTDLFDPAQSLEGGAKYDAELYKRYGDWGKAAAAYVDGPGNLDRAGEAIWQKPTVVNYVRKVMGDTAVETTPAQGAAPDPAIAAQGGALIKDREHLMGRVDSQEKVADTSRADYEKSLDEADKEEKRILAEYKKLEGGVPPPPSLPTIPESPKEIRTDPTRVLGQFLPMMATLAGLRTRSPATATLMAAASAMTAARTNDKEAFAEAHQAFQDKLQETLDQAKAERDQYLDVLNNQRMSMSDKIAESGLVATIAGNSQAKAMADAGALDKLYQHVQTLDVGIYHLDTVLNNTKKAGMEQQRIDLQAKRDAATKEYREAQLPYKKLQMEEKMRTDLAKTQPAKTYDAVNQYMPEIEKFATQIENKPYFQGNALSSADQAAFLDVYTRMITNQAIRGFTLKLNQDHGDLADKGAALLAQLPGAGGGPLSPRQEQDMVRIAKEYKKAIETEYGAEVKRANANVQQYGLGPITPYQVDPSTLAGGGGADASAGGGIPQAALDELRSDSSPANRAHFDEAFGAGAAEAALGN